jgi:hypothetical protein
MFPLSDRLSALRVVSAKLRKAQLVNNAPVYLFPKYDVGVCRRQQRTARVIEISQALFTETIVTVQDEKKEFQAPLRHFALFFGFNLSPLAV